MNIKALLISILLLSGTAFAAPANKDTLFYCPFNNGNQVYLTPLLDNNQRGEIIEIYLRNGDVSYIAAATNIIRKTIYSLSAQRSGTEPEMICKRRGAFINRDMALSLPDLLDTSY